jgi:hypothetical protein
VAPAGPLLLIVNVKTQRATLFRNGVPIAASTVSTGRQGYSTPTGVFTVLQKHDEHYSSKYNNAPMPYMQRLTWGGIALHAGKLPGYPASHGCVRLPAGFAKLLFGVTRLGMTVVVADAPAVPKIAPTPALVSDLDSPELRDSAVEWHPDRAPSGPVSIVVSVPDEHAIVLRNGTVIGSAPVRVDGPISGSFAYSLQSVDAAGQHHWFRVALGASAAADAVPAQEWQRFHAPDAFRKALASVVSAGTTVVVTTDSVSSAAPLATTVIESQ